MTSREPTLPAASAAALTAGLLITGGSSVSIQLLPLVGVPVTVAGFVMASVAALRARRAPAEQSFFWVYIWLSAVTAVGLTVGPPEHGPLWYEILYRVHPALGVVLVGIFAGATPRTRRQAMWTAVASATVLQIATPIAIPRPIVDVWSWTQTSTLALLHGIHPYTVQAPDVYGGAYNFGYTTTVYPYMPLVLAASAPALALFGDYRFGLALCLPVTVALLRATGRRLAVDGHLLDALTLALALHPRAAYIVGTGWMEPLMVVTLASFVYLATRDPDGTAPGVAFMLLPALKQYVATPVLIYLGMRPRPRVVAIGAAVAAATVAPFLIWNWRPTLAGMLAIFTNMGALSAFRDDSDSVTAVVAQVFGVHAGRWLGVTAQLVVGIVAFGLLRRQGVAGLLLASALALIASFLLGTQSFMNYYYFGAAPLVFAALVLARRDAPVS